MTTEEVFGKLFGKFDPVTLVMIVVLFFQMNGIESSLSQDIKHQGEALSKDIKHQEETLSKDIQNLQDLEKEFRCTCKQDTGAGD